MLHERFDLAQWQQRFAFEDEIEGSHITSPFHIVAIERGRKQALNGRDAGVSLPTDVCIFAKGEPDNRAITKVGGLPYWPADAPWPCDSYDTPLTFLAQWNFTDSQDITGTLPGDILVLFGDIAALYGGEKHYAWFSLDQPRALVEQIPESSCPIDPCYALLYRTVDYPDLDCEPFEAYSSAYQFPCLEAMKIGGAPRWIQYPEPLPGRFLCALASVQPAFRRPYPFVNVPEPITTYQELYRTNDLMIGDAGSLYLFLDDAGEVHIADQCY